MNIYGPSLLVLYYCYRRGWPKSGLFVLAMGAREAEKVFDRETEIPQEKALYKGNRAYQHKNVRVDAGSRHTCGYMIHDIIPRDVLEKRRVDLSAVDAAIEEEIRRSKGGRKKNEKAD